MNKSCYKMGLIGLTAIGVGTMIGSGWLFSAYYAAQIAGPSAYIAWLITAVIILLLGLSLAEISFHYPKRGLMARLLVISHNKEFAFICTIATWLGLTAVIATEAEGSVQYLSSLSPAMRAYLFNTDIHELTAIGLSLSILMVILFGVVNFWGIKILSRSNIAITTIKVVIPAITALSIIMARFHGDNFSQVTSGLMPYGFSSIFTAMIGAGMVYSFNGFQNIVSFSSEVKNPKRNIPLAMILSISITLLIYVILETSFIGALSPSLLSNGWHSINFVSPFIQITMMLNLNLMTIILYVDAVISPSGTGIIYTGSTTRMLTGMSEDKQAPTFFSQLSKYDFSRRSLVTTVLLAILFLLLFKSWSSLVSFLSLFYVISYMSIPLCLGKLRNNGMMGKFSLPFIKLLLPLIFMFLAVLFIFAKAPFTGYVTAFISIVYMGYIVSQLRVHNNVYQLFSKSCPILVYLILLTVISFIGPQAYGGIGLLHQESFFCLIALSSLITYFFLVYFYKSTSENCDVEINSVLEEKLQY